MNPTIRDPVAEGTFYPADADELRRALERALTQAEADGARDGGEPTRLLVAPHASLARSGAVAARAHASALIPPLVVILSPSHQGVGAPLALPRAGSWRTPLGVLHVDGEAASAVFAAAGAALPLRDDWRAHARDAATEMQIPFLQVRARATDREPVRLITLACGELPAETLIAAGEVLAAALMALGRERVSECLLLVSADLTSGLPEAEIRREDQALLDLISACEPEALAARVRARGLATCCVPPLVVGLAAARRLGAGRGRVLAHEVSVGRGAESREAVGHAAVGLPPA